MPQREWGIESSPTKPQIGWLMMNMWRLSFKPGAAAASVWIWKGGKRAFLPAGLRNIVNYRNLKSNKRIRPSIFFGFRIAILQTTRTAHRIGEFVFTIIPMCTVIEDFQEWARAATWGYRSLRSTRFTVSGIDVLATPPTRNLTEDIPTLTTDKRSTAQ